jgi:hypothetical protein
VGSAALLAIGAPLRAQSASGESLPDATPRLTPEWDAATYQPHDATLAIRFDEQIDALEGRVAILIGRVDLSALAIVRGARVLLPLRGVRIAAGETEMHVWRVDSGGLWHELGRFPLRLLTGTGFEVASARPRFDVQSDGQLDAHSPDGVPPGGRGASFHDVTMNGGADGELRRNGWDVGWQGLLVGASHRPARLRAGQLGPGAPMVDLASYNVRLARGGFAMTAGHVAVGTHRLLASQHRSRGVTADIAIGRGVSVGLGTVAATEIVGWSDALGLSRPRHRVATGTIGVEMAPSRPGLFRVEFSALNGSAQPVPAFTQQAITDREASSGLGAQVTAASASQRVRLSAGWASSRFANRADPALSGDSVLVPLQEETRAARFGELALELLRGARIGRVPASLAIAVRHERADPLYRSIAAFVQSDREQQTIEATGALGVLQFQASVGSGRDNLAGVPSLLITRTRARTASAALPVSALMRAQPDEWWWPALAVTWQGTTQAGDAIPDNGGFRDASQLPDQYTGALSANVGWQGGGWSVAYRYGRSVIDNRQFQRERADFITDGHAATVNVSSGARLTVAIDLAHERQRSIEEDVSATSRRLGGQADWRPFGRTSLAAGASLVHTRDESSTQRGRNLEMRLEASQGFNLWARSASESQARAFVRWARSGVGLRAAGLRQPDLTQWTLNAGMGLRVF